MQFLRGQSAQAPQFKAPQQRGSQPPAEGKRSLLGLSSTRQVIVTSNQVVAVLEVETATAEAEETGKGSRTSEIHLDLGEVTLESPSPEGRVLSNQNTKHYWNTQVDDVSSGLHSLSLGDRVTRVDTSSCSSLASKVSSSPGSVRESLYLTPEIQQQVLAFLKSLRPGEDRSGQGLG